MSTSVRDISSRDISRHDIMRAVVAVLIAIGVGLYLEGQVREAAQLRASWSTGGAVVVATRDLERGHVLAETDIRAILAPAGLTPDGAVAIGSGETLGRAVANGAILTVLDLKSARTGPPQGRRWIAIPVDVVERPTLLPGDSVDLMGADPFGGTPTMATSAALVVDVSDSGIVVEVAQHEVAAVTSATATGFVIAVLAPQQP